MEKEDEDSLAKCTAKFEMSYMFCKNQTCKPLKIMERIPNTYAVSSLKTKKPKTEVTPIRGRRMTIALVCALHEVKVS